MVFGHKREKVTGEDRLMSSFMICTPHQIFERQNNEGWTVYVARTWVRRGA
jgi:hypothetical protein